MKRKIEISSVERTLIVSACMNIGDVAFAVAFNQRFEDADPASDGPEVDILRVQVQP
jgi:hypothetical protein